MMQAAVVLKMMATLRKQIPPITPASTGCGSSSGSCVRAGYTSIPALGGRCNGSAPPGAAARMAKAQLLPWAPIKQKGCRLGGKISARGNARGQILAHKAPADQTALMGRCNVLQTVLLFKWSNQ